MRLPRGEQRPGGYRLVFVAVEGVTTFSGGLGSLMLATGRGSPPVSALAPLGLSSWRAPAVWLLATTTVPAGVAAWLAWRRSAWAPPAVLVASATLAVELVVQIPFLGPSWLQAAFGLVAAAMTGVALAARRAGWWPRR